MAQERHYADELRFCPEHGSLPHKEGKCPQCGRQMELIRPEAQPALVCAEAEK